MLKYKHIMRLTTLARGIGIGLQALEENCCVKIVDSYNSSLVCILKRFSAFKKTGSFENRFKNRFFPFRQKFS
jgi:hypothetical protein